MFATAGGKEVMIVRSAVAVIEVSTDCVALISDTRCTKGAKISADSLRTRAPRLGIGYVPLLDLSGLLEDLPPDSLILNFTIRII